MVFTEHHLLFSDCLCGYTCPVRNHGSLLLPCFLYLKLFFATRIDKNVICQAERESLSKVSVMGAQHIPPPQCVGCLQVCTVEGIREKNASLPPFEKSLTSVGDENIFAFPALYWKHCYSFCSMPAKICRYWKLRSRKKKSL